MRVIPHSILLLVLMLVGCPKASSEDKKHFQEGQSLSTLIFVGRSVRGFQSYPFDSTDGAQDFIGLSAAWTPVNAPFGFRLGLDGGVSLREDEDIYGPSGNSGEIWLGPTIRHEGIELGPVLLKPALTVGFSAVTNSNGLERQREIEESGDAAFLYYYGPEIAFSASRFPNIDLVYRLHHRSGAGEVSMLPTLGSIGDTMNANMLGIRVHF